MSPRPKTTVLADDTTVDAPQSTSPGDAPADTFDATEIVSSATPDKAAAAEAGHLSVNAVANVESPYVTAPEGEARTETIFVSGPSGAQVEMERDIVTGATTAPAGGEDVEP